MQFIRRNEIEDIYQCKNCLEYTSVPKRADNPVCECGVSKIPHFKKVDEEEQNFAGCDSCVRLKSGDKYKLITEKEEVATYCETCLSEKFGIEVDNKGELRSEKLHCIKCGENSIRVLTESRGIGIISCWDCDNNTLQRGAD